MSEMLPADQTGKAGSEHKQNALAAAKNTSFFGDGYESYNQNVQELDTYVFIREHLNQAIQGMGKMLDIGNGGVFDYDTSLAREVVGVDLFLDAMPPSYRCPPNVTLKQGNALDLPFEDNSFDGVLVCMLLHHLIGNSVKESLTNLERAMQEAVRVLRPGGKLIIMESCVPSWFYWFERLVFPVVSRIINWTMSHPATIQYPPRLIGKLLKSQLQNVTHTRVPKGRWILQLGFKFPACLTPAAPHLWTGKKAA